MSHCRNNRKTIPNVGTIDILIEVLPKKWGKMSISENTTSRGQVEKGAESNHWQ